MSRRKEPTAKSWIIFSLTSSFLNSLLSAYGTGDTCGASKKIYTYLLLGGKLNSCLAEIGQKIKEMFSRPIISDSYAREHYEKTQSRRSDGMDEKDELHLHLYKRNIL
ncbi:TnpV protein [Lawsonibacter sp. OA9]|nr:TnpV protein [Lawsonibacter sp. OA9]MCH1980221.1 TnpV protein [Lawsonibacter sp. OA9]